MIYSLMRFALNDSATAMYIVVSLYMALFFLLFQWYLIDNGCHHIP